MIVKIIEKKYNKKLPESNKIAAKWNDGVETVFNVIGNSGQVLEISKQKLNSLVANSSNNKN